VSRASLRQLHALAKAYGGRPSAYAGLTDPLHALWLDEAALMLAGQEQTRAVPQPPDPLNQLFRKRP